MAPEAAANVPEDLEQLRRRFEEYRNAQSGRSRLPEELWEAAAELAKHYGTHQTARALRLEYMALRKRAEKQDAPKAKRKTAVRRKVATPPSFMEFVAPGAKPVTSCVVEVESREGSKLRLELKSVATAELADLIRAFANR